MRTFAVLSCLVIVIGGVLCRLGVWISWRAISHFIYRKGSMPKCMAMELFGMIVMDAGLLCFVWLYFL
jgi:hypothetical protein